MPWQWSVSTETETINGEAVGMLTAARRVASLLEHSPGVASAEITGPDREPVRMHAVDGAIRAEGDDGDDASAQ